jgi:hypothetical protein
MRYLCLAYHDLDAWDAMGPPERDALRAECAAYDEVLRKRGHYVLAKFLPQAAVPATLRFEDGKVSLAASPIAGNVSKPCGVLVLEARDLNHAIQLMSQLPCMRPGGSLEICPIDEELSALPEKPT